MGRPLIDRSGDRVGRLAVIRRADDKITANGKSYVQWLCGCDCGVEVLVMSGHLNEANTTSCGCALRDILTDRNTTHGGTGTVEHEIWRGMKERCENPNTQQFCDYGGRGISICDRWRDFSAFLEDMGQRPSPLYSIDRMDVNGNYEPVNCRWATDKEQSRNRRNNILVKVGGASMPLSQAVEVLGGDNRVYKGVHKRMKYKGMTFESAIASVRASGLFNQLNLGVPA